MSIITTQQKNYISFHKEKYDKYDKKQFRCKENIAIISMASLILFAGKYTRIFTIVPALITVGYVVEYKHLSKKKAYINERIKECKGVGINSISRFSDDIKAAINKEFANVKWAKYYNTKYDITAITDKVIPGTQLVNIVENNITQKVYSHPVYGVINNISKDAYIMEQLSRISGKVPIYIKKIDGDIVLTHKDGLPLYKYKPYSGQLQFEKLTLSGNAEYVPETIMKCMYHAKKHNYETTKELFGDLTPGYNNYRSIPIRKCNIDSEIFDEVYKQLIIKPRSSYNSGYCGGTRGNGFRLM